ncbi:armadillo repeat-containing protein 3-like isoform X1 [Phyllopteryx taeniolatus]|uniref:armadillo repeat-containing protein 3-like isoform X1 n=1 Tax=Phyllopteryx taeniolatus TaxID=161469 RepID=UPI002AD3188D|nr:armadillo repeat-containing protein 3-like isoform X1 [Phyllopteryx taeniolatus]XP_061614547.1 armadillo repeat-containing protein 3-like isoform X1 [Phyllopteryx taeniolatus]
MDKKDKKERKSKCSTPCKETFEPLRVDVKTTATAVLLLSSPEEDIVVTACEAIFEFAEEDANKVYLMELGALQRLTQLIAHTNELVRRNAFMILGTVASHSAVGNALQQMDVIAPIIDKLSLDDSVIQEYGTLCLSYLSLAPSCKVQIFDNKGLPALIKLLSSSEPDVQKNSLETIYNLIQNSQFCPYLLELGGIPLLLELLNSDYAVIQQLALKTLQKVTADKESHGTIRKEQGLDKLISIIQNVDFCDLHVEALQVLVNCASDSDNFHLVRNGGGLTTLLELVVTRKLSETGSPVKCNTNEVQSRAVECISTAAQNSDNHKVLHDFKVEEILVDLLSGNSDCVKTFVCQAMAGMSSFLSSKERFRDLGGLPALTRLLSSGNLLVRGEAIQALANLTAGHKQNSMTIYEEGGHKILVQRLRDSCPRIAANAAAILCRIAGEEAIRCDVLSLGAIPALVEPLRSTDSQVLINATLCICELAFDASARAELQSAGGLEPLVNLLRSTHMEVLRSACMAISVCAKDEPTSMEMCKFGALEMLNEINQADNSKSRFSEFALNSLMQSSPSLKYALTDHLASTDILTDGFYDAGKLCFGQKVLTLAELSMEPVNQRLPIVVVNAAIEVFLHQKSVEEGYQTERYWKVINDVALRFLVKEVKESIALLNDEQEQYVALARQVSDVMGGAIEKEDLHTFGWLLHICLLKCKVQCNVVPIGMISKGFYCHRALLFKYLADCIGLSCTLVRGDYNRAWNEVLLRNEHSSQPRRYIVDLMHQPGSFLRTPRGGPVPRLRSACALMKIADSKRVTSRHLSL